MTPKVLNCNIISTVVIKLCFSTNSNQSLMLSPFHNYANFLSLVTSVHMVQYAQKEKDKVPLIFFRKEDFRNKLPSKFDSKYFNFVWFLVCEFRHDSIGLGMMQV